MADAGADGISQSTQLVLILAGSGAVLLGLFFVYGIFSCVKGAVGAVLSLAPKSKPQKKTKKYKGSDSEQETPYAPVVPGKERGPDLKSLIKAEKAAKKKGDPKDDKMATHELFINTLKDHADTVHAVAWSPDGQQVATACEDMQLRIFDLADLGNKNPKFKRVKTARIPIGVGFGDDAGSVAAGLKGVPDAMVAYYMPMAKSASDVPLYDAKWTVNNAHGKEPPLAMQSVPSKVAAGGRGVIVCLSNKKEGRVYSMAGAELAVFEPNSLANYDLATSGDGKFIAVASFSTDVKVWEMRYDREGIFKGCIKAMSLAAHKGQVMSVALSADNKRAATASKDGMLKVWDIDVRYQLSEDPKVKLSVPMALPDGRVYSHLAFGPPGCNLLAASHEGTVHFLSLATGELLERIDAHDLPITCMRWCPVVRKVAASEGAPANTPAFVLATCSRDRRVRIWRAPS